MFRLKAAIPIFFILFAPLVCLAQNPSAKDQLSQVKEVFSELTYDRTPKVSELEALIQKIEIAKKMGLKNLEDRREADLLLAKSYRWIAGVINTDYSVTTEERKRRAILGKNTARKARGILDNLLKEYPNDREVLAEYIEVSSQLGQSSLPIYQRMLSANPEDNWARAFIGFSQIRKDKFREGIGNLKRAIAAEKNAKNIAVFMESGIDALADIGCPLADEMEFREKISSFLRADDGGEQAASAKKDKQGVVQSFREQFLKALQNHSCVKNK
jgi:hypothetical protein